MSRTGALVAALAVAAAICVAFVYVHHRQARADPTFRPSTFVPAARTSATRPSAGCGVRHESPRGEQLQAGDRSYVAWGPSTYDPARAYPVVVVFHGWHTSAASFASWFTMESYVDGAAFVVYPEAADGTGDTWDVGSTRDLDAFDHVMDDLAARFCVDRARVLALGFSYGGKLAHHLGCTRPDRVKAIAVGDGSMGSHETGCGSIPALVTHRTVDPDELFAWGVDATNIWKEESGCAAASDLVDPVHACRTYRGCRAPVTFCEDGYANPAWPAAWNHTIREEYRALTWQWFQSLP